MYTVSVKRPKLVIVQLFSKTNFDSYSKAQATNINGVYMFATVSDNQKTSISGILAEVNVRDFLKSSGFFFIVLQSKVTDLYAIDQFFLNKITAFTCNGN